MRKAPPIGGAFPERLSVRSDLLKLV
jgi:hypothetical protein